MSPNQGWVQLDALVRLHPNHALLADLDRRMQTLQQQQAQIGQAGNISLPPQQTTITTPALAALPNPPEPAQLERYTPKMRSQALAALQRFLERERVWKLDGIRTELERAAEASLAQTEQRLQEQAATERARIEEAYRLPLFQARLGKEMAAWKSSDQVQLPSLYHQRVDWANSTYDALYADYQSELRNVNVKLEAEKHKALTQEKATISQELRQHDERLRAEIRQQLDEADLWYSVQATRTPVTMPVPPIDFAPLPDGQITHENADVAGRIRRSAARAEQATAGTVRELERSLLALRRQRQELERDMQRDTLAAASAVAAQHGYQLTASSRQGRNLTRDVTNWLQEYWSPTW